MAKFVEKLPKEEVEKLFYKLCNAVALTKNIEEASELIQDLLSLQEAEMIAKRLKIAEFLEQDLTYSEIQKAIKTSPSTIARVHEWLKSAGQGFRLAIQRTKGDMPSNKNRSKSGASSWRSIKRRYPMYYWPELLIEELIRQSSQKQKEKIKNVLKKMDNMKEKTKLYKQLRRVVSDNSPS